MWNRRQCEFIKEQTTYVQPASNVLSAQTLEYRIRPTRLRLEGFLFQFVMVTNAAIATNCEGLAGVVEEIEVTLNDGLGSGSRQAFKASGPALIELARQNGFKLTPSTKYCSTDSVTVLTGTTYELTIPVLFRHPLLQEPKAMLTSVPLYAPFVTEDVVIKVKLRASTAISATATPFTSAYPFLLPLYRQPSQVAGLDGYIPMEFKEDVFFPNKTGEVVFDVPKNGVLTGLLFRNHTTNAYSASQASAGLVNAMAATALPTNPTGKLKLKVNKTILQEHNELTLWGLNHANADLTNRVDLTATSGIAKVSTAFWLDLLADFANTDASSLATAIDVSGDGRGGNDVQIVFNDWLNANYACRIATHKFFPLNPDDLMKFLSFGV